MLGRICGDLRRIRSVVRIRLSRFRYFALCCPPLRPAVRGPPPLRGCAPEGRQEGFFQMQKTASIRGGFLRQFRLMWFIARALRMAEARTGAMTMATAMLKVVAGSFRPTATSAALAVVPLTIMVFRKLLHRYSTA